MRPKSPYWNWLASAFALAGIILFVFATLGPPASSSGFVSTLKGVLETWVPAIRREILITPPSRGRDHGSSPLPWAWPPADLSADAPGTGR